MATYIDGIGASENIDTSGERVSMAGLDISSLTIDGVFNWEHKKDEPSQVVGKILQAKKILSEADCENDRHSYFWNKIQTPYLYVMGELMDDYKDSAKEVAGMFRYDADRKNQNERNVMNFSVEGGKIEKVGMDVLKSVARKITITVLPCNKAAVAEMVPNPGQPKQKDDLESIFKTEPNIEIELFKPANPENFAEMIKREEMKKAVIPMQKAGNTQNPQGSKLGSTKSGKDVFSHSRVADYHGFSSQDHADAAALHGKASEGHKGAASKLFDHHIGKMKLHAQASQTAATKELRTANVESAHRYSRPGPPAIKSSSSHKFVNIPGKGRGIEKSENEKGVHPNASGGDKYKGQSPSGKHIRGGLGEKDYAQEAQKDIKPLHNKVLKELKAMPKPNLAKTEDGQKQTGIIHRGHDIVISSKDGEHKAKVISGKQVGHETASHASVAEAAKAAIRHIDYFSTPKHNLAKSMTAGSGNVAPSQLEGGAALAKESLEGKRRKAASSKSPWFARAEQEYMNWSKREEFEQFMAKRMPHLAKGEIVAIGQTIALQKAVSMEKALSDLNKKK